MEDLRMSATSTGNYMTYRTLSGDIYHSLVIGRVHVEDCLNDALVVENTMFNDFELLLPDGNGAFVRVCIPDFSMLESIARQHLALVTAHELWYDKNIERFAYESVDDFVDRIESEIVEYPEVYNLILEDVTLDE